MSRKLEGKKGKLFAFSRDDITKEEDTLNAFQWTKDNLGSVLINNAGVFRLTSLIEKTLKFWKKILDINVPRLCIATREAVKDMRSNNNVAGDIIHIHKQ